MTGACVQCGVCVDKLCALDAQGGIRLYFTDYGFTVRVKPYGFKSKQKASCVAALSALCNRVLVRRSQPRTPQPANLRVLTESSVHDVPQSTSPSASPHSRFQAPQLPQAGAPGAVTAARRRKTFCLDYCRITVGLLPKITQPSRTQVTLHAPPSQADHARAMK